jgi:hypothetical protein
MKTVQVGEFKANFSSYLKDIDKGEVIEVTYGKSNEIKGYFVPPLAYSKIRKRRIGILDGLAAVEFMPDFKIIDEEKFFGLK